LAVIAFLLWYISNNENEMNGCLRKLHKKIKHKI
jgi:hypothetical protein